MMEYSKARAHMVALRQCVLLCEPSAIATAMKEAADFLESTIPVLDHVERRVLLILQSVGEDYAMNFKGIGNRYRQEFGQEISRKTIRDYCWKLKLKGLAVYRNGLMSEIDGAVAGSGYSVTTEGAKFYVEEPIKA
ncbi:hypothetical protein Milano_066 [Agrobacterium phage Milano]|nr:hypothetical protein Milano_066 [Agrobacterium phage Milano]